jgi:HSP20 family protein
MLIWRRPPLPSGSFEEEETGLTLTWRPDMDVFEVRDEYLLSLSLPGVRAEDVEVTVTGRTLLVSGERRLAVQDGAVAHLIESSAGRFKRPVRLPPNADTERISSELVDGQLNIHVPKRRA